MKVNHEESVKEKNTQIVTNIQVIIGFKYTSSVVLNRLISHLPYRRFK